MIYRSLFLRSSIADVSIGNTGWFGLYRNTSLDSRRFLQTAAVGANGGAVLLQANRILDTTDPVAIEFGNEGPLILLDNLVASTHLAGEPVVRMIDGSPHADRDVLSLGNRYVVRDPIGFRNASGRVLADGDRTVERAGLDSGLPSLPGTAPDHHRRVFEVPAGADTARIQQAIDAAAASGADNPVVHLPAGDYHLSRTLLVPANKRLQLAGDSEATKVWWSGADPAGTMIRLEGPSYATLREIGLLGHEATGIEMTRADQPGGRIFVEGSRIALVSIAGLSATRVDFQANSGIDGLIADASSSVLAIGGFGPVHLSGASNVLESDNWYEGDRALLFAGDSGTFTYLGGELAPYSHGVRKGLDPDAPSILLDGFNGQASFIGGTLSLPRVRNGVQVRSAGKDTTALFFGLSATKENFYDNRAKDGKLGLVFSKFYSPRTGAVERPDVGRSDMAFIVDGFDQARSLVWESEPFPHTDRATDVRMFRVFTDNTAVGLRVRGD
jgi:hypothetical protein